MTGALRASAGWMLLLAMFTGCAKDVKTASLHLPSAEEARRAAIEREWVEGPVHWVDPEGRVCLEIPADWSGWRGWEPGDPILTLQHPSGVKAILHEGPPPAAREGLTRVYEDPEGRWRDLPALFPASTVTWLAPPGGPTVIEWYGGEAPVLRVELVLPWGRAVQGRLEADALLRGLCRPDSSP